ncbi:MAG TPA: hypothetical protein VHQ21_11435, partial [Rhodanobacteraceae bacterium]|nr:hypothetical protein [Rhodanobacteraceae bacterium]
MSSGLIAELKRRNVIRMAGLYLVGAWLLTQVASTVLPMFGAPDWLPRTVVILLALGFIPALIFAWVFELTPEGLKRDAQIKPEESIAPQTARRMDRMIFLVMALALAYFAFDKFLLAPQREAARENRVEPALRIHGETDTSRPAAKLSNPEPQAKPADGSIAVLPFVNMSSDKEQEYFSDGLSEELLNQLAQIPQLRVIARTSSFSFKGKELDVETIAGMLKVAHILEGSVRKSGTTLRITAQLIRTSDSSHLWSKTYDRELTDIFKVQDEIANEVVGALKVKLLPAQLPRGQRTENFDAYEHYLRGQNAAQQLSLVSDKRAASEFQQAIELDPNYANAYAGLAASQGWIAEFESSPAQRGEVIKQAIAAAEKAIALDPDLAAGHAVRGWLRAVRIWDWQGAAEDFERASALEPNRVATLGRYAPYLLFIANDKAAGLAMIHKATVLDPLSSDAWMSLCRMLYAIGEEADALAACQRAIDLSPKSNWPTYLMGYFAM